MKQHRIALYGARGSGKTTIGERLKQNTKDKSIQVVPSALPIYQVQKAIYEAAGMVIGNSIQDEEILAGAAALIRKLNPVAFFDHVSRSLQCSSADIFVCPDTTPADRDYFAAAGFTFWYVAASPEIRKNRLSNRNEIYREKEPLTSNVPIISKADVIIHNEGSLESLDSSLAELINRL